MATESRTDSQSLDPQPIVAPCIRSVEQTRCCVVGGGPAGGILALLLARQGISVMLLEAHEDFDRDFGGDTIHPAILEILDEIDLTDGLLELRTRSCALFLLPGASGPTPLVTFSHLHTRFPFIALLPQVRFLEYLVGEAHRYPAFHLVMGASVQELLDDGGVVRGDRYRSKDGWHEVRALLTVAADGRDSRLRKLSRLPRRSKARRRWTCSGSVCPAGQTTMKASRGGPAAASLWCCSTLATSGRLATASRKAATRSCTLPGWMR